MNNIGEGEKDYYKYLTNKLDKGAPNIVVDTVIDIVLREMNAKSILRVLEIGCFTGSILNRIYWGLPQEIRKRIELWGFDKDQKIISKASQQRPHIFFEKYDLTGRLIAGVGSFDILILSNILHEIYSCGLPSKRKSESLTKKAIGNVSNLITSEGYLVLLDGILPNNYNKSAGIQFLDSQLFKEFIEFSKSDYIMPISYSTTSTNTLKTTLANLSAFLTKARYLEESYWNLEAKQIYQYFTIQKFHKVLLENQLSIEEIKFQPINKIEERVKIVHPPSLKIPPKNVLIKARKLNPSSQ